MFGLSPIRLYIYAAIALALVGMLWHDKIGWDLAKKRKAEVTVLTTAIKTERANRATEQADRRRADDIVKPVEIKVARIATRPDPVGVLCRPASLPAASQGRGPAGADDPAVDRGDETPLRDIGSALGAARREAETNNARHEGLIEFERSRTH